MLVTYQCVASKSIYSVTFNLEILSPLQMSILVFFTIPYAARHMKMSMDNYDHNFHDIKTIKNMVLSVSDKTVGIKLKEF